MINATFKKFLCAAVLAMLSPLPPAAADGGTIHFRGAIVEGGCGITPQEQQVVFSCYKQGKPANFTVALSELAEGVVRSDNLIHTDIQYLDSQRRLALVNITYQ
jgi:type 1 fimbria pilin